MFRQRFPIVTELQNNEETLRDFTPATMSPDALMAIWTELESLREQLERHPLKQRADFPKLQRDLERRKRFKAELASLDASRAKMERFSLADEFDTRLAILQVKPMMKYVSEKNVLTHKAINFCIFFVIITEKKLFLGSKTYKKYFIFPL